MSAERQELRKQIDARPDDAAARLRLAEILLSDGEPEASVRELRSVVRLQMHKNQFAMALRACRMALSVQPNNVELRLLLAQLHARMPEADESGRAARPTGECMVVDLAPDARLEEVDLVEAVAVIDIEAADQITRPPMPAMGEEEGSDDPAAGSAIPIDDADQLVEVSAFEESGADPAADSAIPIDDVDQLVEVPAFEEFGHEITRQTGTVEAAQDAEPPPDRRRSVAERLAGPPADRNVMGAVATAVDPERLPLLALFRDLPQESRDLLVERAELVEYRDNGRLVEVGEPVDRLMLLIDGVIRVLNDSAAGDTTDVAGFRTGELIGEFEFLTGAPSRVAIQTEGPANVIEIHRADLDRMRKEDATLDDTVERLLKERIVNDLIDRSPVFSSLTGEQRGELAERFFPLAVGQGEVLLRQGDINRRLFIVKTGELVVDGRGTGGAGRLLLSSGDFFGFVSTVLGRPVQVAVVAAAPSSLLVLPEQEVYRLVASNKGVARAARREALERGDAPISVHTIGGLGGLAIRHPEPD